MVAAEAVAKAAMRRYGPAHLKRGGAVGRAQAQLGKGLTVAQAASRAARWQGKGHAGELRLAAELCLDAGMRGSTVLGRPNAIANDRHVDIEVMVGPKRAATVQVGVGAPRYLRRKARTSLANEVVVNVEGRESLKALDPSAYGRTTDRLQFGETSSKQLVEAVVTRDATEILRDALSGSGRLSELFKLAVAGGAGIEAALTSFGRSLLFGVLHRWSNERPLDETLVNEAMDAGVDAFFKTGVHTFVVVSDFLEKAGTLFNGRLLRSVGGKIVAAGVIAEVVVTTARDIWAHLRGEIAFEEVVRRAISAFIVAAGGAGGYALALKLTAGAPPWVTFLATLALVWGGGWLAADLAKALVGPVRRPLLRVPA